MTSHRRTYKVWKDGKGGKISSYELFDEYGVENCEIILLELCPCNSKDELTSRESHYIRTLDCVNKKIPGRKREQYKIDNPDYDRNYYINNKDKVLDNCKMMAY
jgi:hypothetical protein